MTIFTAVRPVCPVVDMAQHLRFWTALGFATVFADRQPSEAADYAVVSREGLVLHLQTFGREELKLTQVMALRIEMRDRAAVEALHEEWAPLIAITAPLRDTDWGTREFGFYDPVGAPFFFYANRKP